MKSPTFDEVRVICDRLSSNEICRMLNGPLGYQIPMPAKPSQVLPPEMMAYLGIANWLKGVIGMHELAIHSLLATMRPYMDARLDRAWRDLETTKQPQLLTSFFIGVFDNRWVTWSNRATDNEQWIDTETCATIGELPHKHMWTSTLDLMVLVGRMWGELKTRRESKDARKQSHQGQAAGS